VSATRRSINDELKAEADRLLDTGLRALLEQYGEAHVIGSYALGLMTWRDLDIHVVREPPEVDAFFALGGSLAALLEPHRMHFRDERRVQTAGLPCGLYWGIYLGDERAGAWKIDIWQTGAAGFEPVRQFGDRLAARLTGDARAAIHAIKTACWRHAEYRRGFTSADVYAAVLDRGVRSVEEFWAYLRETKGL
jgi:hypothetical protein